MHKFPLRNIFVHIFRGFCPWFGLQERKGMEGGHGDQSSPSHGIQEAVRDRSTWGQMHFSGNTLTEQNPTKPHFPTVIRLLNVSIGKSIDNRLSNLLSIDGSIILPHT